ncbi:MAG TPA: right-handed parallel beta-helix repeat-containing protein [Flavobacteriales bacterium]
MRHYKRARPRPNAWLFALGIPAVVLFAVFSLLPYERMVARWPFGIGEQEVMAYQRWFDRRPGQHVEVEAEEFAFSTLGGGRRSLVAKGYSGEVSVSSRPEVNGSYEVVFPDDSLFRGQKSIVLMPADSRSLKHKYAQLMADALGLMAPDLTLVRVRMDGEDEGFFVKEERISPAYILKGRADGATLLKAGTVEAPLQPADTVGSDVGPVRFRMASTAEDDAMWAALGLLLQAQERRDLPEGDGALVYSPWRGSVEPIHRAFPTVKEVSADTAAPLVRFARQRMRSPSTYERMLELADTLRADSAVWAGRFAAVDSLWGPALSEGRSLGLTGAATTRQRERFLQRVFHPDAEAFFGPAVAATVDSTATTALPAWMERFRTEPDTVRLHRGKYDIEGDIRMPEGVALVLERGTRLFFAPGANLVINGAFHARGTDLNPVFIRPAEEGGRYGSISVQGSGNTPVVLRGVRMSGGQGGWIDGTERAGMLSFDRSNVRMDHCTLEGPSTGALVAIRRGQVMLRDNFLSGAKGTALLCEAVQGEVKACHFTGEGMQGASGIRLHGGQVLVSGCTFNALDGTGLAATRAAQVLLLSGTFKGCATAVLVEDLAVAHVDRCSFEGYRLAFEVRKRTASLGGGRLALYRNEGLGLGTDRAVDRYSSVTSAPAPDPVAWKQFGVYP